MFPLEIVFRNVDRTPAVEEEIRQRAAKLAKFYDGIVRGYIVVEVPHRHRKNGVRHAVRIELSVPGEDIVVSHEPSPHVIPEDIEHGRKRKDTEANVQHRDLQVALRDAFEAARRKLQDHVRVRRRMVKAHEPAPAGRVVRLFPEEGYGFILALDGREIYFHEHSVLEGAFSKLAVGSEVVFAEERGEKGPQASTVRVAGRG